MFISSERDLADKLEAGTYILRKNMTPEQLVTALLVSHDLAVTIPLREGLRLEQITAKLETLPLTMDFKTFYDEVKNPPKSLLADYPWLDLPKGACLEGFLAPATYRVLPEVTADELIRQMLDAFYLSVGPDRLKVAKSPRPDVLPGPDPGLARRARGDPRRGAAADRRRLPEPARQDARSSSTPTPRSSTPTTRSSWRKLPFADWKDYAFWAPPRSARSTTSSVPEALAGYQSYISRRA